MITVDKFLCFKLETGGLVIGWLSLIGNILGAFASLIGLIFFGILNCDNPSGTNDHNAYNPETYNRVTNRSNECNTARLIFIGVFLFCIALCAGFAYIGWICIQGTKARNHFRVKPLMILMATAAVGSILQIFRLTSDAVVSGIINVIINGYCFVVLYSLYSAFRMEYETGANRHQLRQPSKV